MRRAGTRLDGTRSVLIVTDGAPRSDSTLDDFVAELSDRGARVTVVSPGTAPWEGGPTWARDLTRWSPPDVVHVTAYQYASLGWTAPVVLAPAPCPLSGRAAVEGAPPFGAEATDEIVRAIAGADAVVVPTRARLSELELIVGPAGGLKGLSRARVIPAGRRRRARGGERKEPLILAVGTLGQEAGNLEAAAAAARGAAWPMVLAGPHAAPDFGPHAWLSCVDTRREPLDDWAARASIAVFPDRYDAAGLGPLDAAGAGCALLLADIPCYREVWGRAACFFPADNRRALAGAIDALAADDRLRADLGERARERSRLFDAGRMADDYLALYDELARQPAAA